MKIMGKNSVFVCILCLIMLLCGIGIGSFWEYSSTLQQRRFIENNIYVYDSQEKIDKWFQHFENDMKIVAADMNLSKEEYEELFVKFKTSIPIAAVGKIGIFYNRVTDEYQLVEHGLHKPIAALGVYLPGQKFRQFDGAVLEGSFLPHATIHFLYNEDGSLMRGSYMTQNQNGHINRIYYDTDGTGQFDQMVINEDGKPQKYKMVEMTWTKTNPNAENHVNNGSEPLAESK